MTPLSQSCAVATATIGRSTLRDTIESVRDQTRIAKHYVFVHGREYSGAARAILDCYPDVHAIYLPTNNDRGIPGKIGGYGAAPVYAMAPYVVAEDIIFYLDDDNTYDKRHVSTVARLMEVDNLGFAFALRHIVANDGAILCDDNSESLGYFPNISWHFVSDSSCMAVRSDLARRCAFGWYRRVAGDRHFLAALMDEDTRGGCTGHHTVNYRLSTDSSSKGISEAQFQERNAAMAERYPDGLPWLKPTLQDFRSA